MDIGDIVDGVVSDVHKDKVIVSLQPTQVTALLSLNNLANRRQVSVAQLRAALKVGEKLQDLVVTSRNPEKGFVLVAMKPKEKEQIVQKSQLSLDTLQSGQLVGGRVLRHNRHGALVKVTNSIHGVLHPTDACDDYENGKPFPAVDSVLKAVVLAVDKEKRQLSLSTRMSRLFPAQDKPIVDREVSVLEDLTVGDTVRGFIKSVAEHGLFVTLGRNIDARVQIRELFDDVGVSTCILEGLSMLTWPILVREGLEEQVHSKPTCERPCSQVCGLDTLSAITLTLLFSVDVEKKQVELSFRSGDLKRETRAQLTLSDLSEGQKIDGRVKRVEEYGIFIAIEGSRLSGLCHKSEVSSSACSELVYLSNRRSYRITKTQTLHLPSVASVRATRSRLSSLRSTPKSAGYLSDSNRPTLRRRILSKKSPSPRMMLSSLHLLCGAALKSPKRSPTSLKMPRTVLRTQTRTQIRQGRQTGWRSI